MLSLPLFEFLPSTSSIGFNVIVGIIAWMPAIMLLPNLWFFADYIRMIFDFCSCIRGVMIDSTGG